MRKKIDLNCDMGESFGAYHLGNDEALMDKCYTVHNHGTSRRGRTEAG